MLTLTLIEISDILEAVCSFFHVSQSDITGPSRQKSLVRARHVGMYLAREAGHTFRAIAAGFGRLNHVTIFFAVARIESAIANEPGVGEQVEYLRGLLVAPAIAGRKGEA